MLSSGGETRATSFEISPVVLLAGWVEPAERKAMARVEVGDYARRKVEVDGELMQAVSDRDIRSGLRQNQHEAEISICLRWWSRLPGV